MITAETITDAQIRELADDALYSLRFEGDRTKVLAYAHAALNTDPWIQAKRPDERPKARGLIASLLNARAPRGWTLYIITSEGRKVPHWTDTTRAKCRAMKPRDLPTGVRMVVEKESR